jgi:hypothetical protein
VRPPAQLGALAGGPGLELALGEELQFLLVAQRYLDERRPEEAERAELEQLRPERVEQVEQQATDVCTRIPYRKLSAS